MGDTLPPIEEGARLGRSVTLWTNGSRRRGETPAGTALTRPTEPNALWCADYKGEFMLGDRRYC